jgi:hypothetical protein
MNLACADGLAKLRQFRRVAVGRRWEEVPMSNHAFDPFAVVVDLA